MGEKFPKEQQWMNGRQVFIRPESRASTMAKRDIVSSEAERDEVTRALVESTLARRALSADDVEAEIITLDKLDKQQSSNLE